MIAKKLNLRESGKNIYSQNGDDGIIDKIFNIIGTESKICCEFGAWDGIHLSNTRNLILNGWTGILIEGDKRKFEELEQTYSGNMNVHCIQAYVDVNHNDLLSIGRRSSLEKQLSALDFLSIDIDGLDYEIFQDLKLLPRVICIEVNGGHSPDSDRYIERDIAKNNVGQSLRVFTKIGESKGYGLVCYTGNAFLIRNDIMRSCGIRPISSLEAYADYLENLSSSLKEWLYLVNAGIVPPFYKFKNGFATISNLNIARSRAAFLIIKNRVRFQILKLLKRC